MNSTHLDKAPVAEPAFEGVSGTFFPIPNDLTGVFYLRNSTDNFDAQIYAELRNGHRVVIAYLKFNSTAEGVLKSLTHNYAHIRESIELEKLKLEEERQSLNAFERRQEERRDRLHTMATKKRREAHNAFDTSHNTLSHMPFGQPILVGHHSEKRHRAAIARSCRLMDKACQLDKTANYYEDRADKVGSGGVSSDDPDAINKLENKLQNLKTAHEKMIAANKIIRKKTISSEEKNKQLFCLGFSDKQISQIINPEYGHVGFAPYSLQNNNANIKATEKRIEQLKSVKEIDEQIKFYNGFEVEIDKEDNRILFRFDSRPSKEVCSLMRKSAFKFSPTRSNSWVRQLTKNALSAKERLVEALERYMQ